MSKSLGWFVFLVALALLLAACGPPMATPTPRDREPVGDSPAQTEATTEAKLSTPEPVAAGELPVDPNDWRALGSEDAPVTIIEYSDFQ